MMSRVLVKLTTATHVPTSTKNIGPKATANKVANSAVLKETYSLMTRLTAAQWLDTGNKESIGQILCHSMEMWTSEYGTTTRIPISGVSAMRKIYLPIRMASICLSVGLLRLLGRLNAPSSSLSLLYNG